MCFQSTSLRSHALCLGGGMASAVAFLDINWSELIRRNWNLKNSAFFSFSTFYFSVYVYVFAVGYRRSRLMTQ